MKTHIKNLLLLLLLLGLPAVVQAQFNFTTNNGAITITGYTGFSDYVVIPAATNGYPVTSIGDYTFEYDFTIISVIIPNSVTSIGDSTFLDCGMTIVSIPNSVTNIGPGAFSNCHSLTNVTIPNSVNNIGDSVFYACESLTSVTIPDSVTNIGDSAFGYCPSLTSVTIPNSVTSIGDQAFFQCYGLPSVTIPASVTTIGDSVFNSCISLTNINVDAANPAYSSLGGVLFDKAHATLLEFPGDLGGSYTIPNSVISIGDQAFYYCTGLTNVTIPGSVTNIVVGAFEFSGLTSVTILYGVPNIGNGAFENCYNLTSVTIPNSVTSIGAQAFFQCYPLTSVTIPNSVTSIGAQVFFDCVGLTNVTIGNSVTNIGVGAFEGCGLTSVTIPNSITSVGVGAFEFSGLTSVTIPGSVISIADGAFEGCISLTNVMIPNSVTSIGDGAFAGCTSLTSVTIPDSVTSIGDDDGGEGVFASCTSLTSITLPNDLTNCAGAFAGSGLTNVTFASGTTSIVPSEFSGCTSLTSITIPNSVTSIGNGAFYGCTSLTSITIPNSVTNIGYDALFNCTSLRSANFLGNAPTPNNDSSVFSGDPATVYYLPGTTGWGTMFDNRPTATRFLANPQILNNGDILIQFSGGVPGALYDVEESSNLLTWTVAATNPANAMGSFSFEDTATAGVPMQFYRARAAFAYTVGGTLTGLPAGDTVTLQDNGSDNLTLSTNGTFTFPTALPNGQAYSITISGTSGGLPITCTLANSSGTISGANVTNVAVKSGYPALTGNRDLDMYNAALWDGTANGGVPGVMLTENGGPVRVTALGRYSDNICEIYSGWAVFTQVVGTGSCSSTTFPSGTYVIQFGTVLECGFGPYGY
jgi:hypothetical protein